MTNSVYRYRSLIIRLFLRCLGAYILANVMLIYVPPSALSLGAIVLLAGISLLLDHRKILPLAFSLVFITVILEIIVRVGGAVALNPYYRPHERLALETSYRPNEKVEMDVPHGDLLAIDPMLPRELAEARHEVFVTDSLGYRNDKNYEGERLIIIGDSFVLGTETNITMRLMHNYGIPAYNISFSGSGPLIYSEKVQWARQQLEPESCIVLFFFEGNDFQLINPDELRARDSVPRGFQAVAKGYVQSIRRHSELSKAFYGLLARANETVHNRMSMKPARRDYAYDASDVHVTEKTFVKLVGGKPMAFLRGYADVVRRPTYDDYGFIRSRLEIAKPDLVIFIPEKYRVYRGLISDKHINELPNAQWEHLKNSCKDLQIPIINLTEHIVNRSRELLGKGHVTYWRDDTHWNLYGEDVAAEVVVNYLKSSTNINCVRALNREKRLTYE